MDKCNWCEPGSEVCGTCRLYFDYYGDGTDECSAMFDDKPCSSYEPINFCPKCGRPLIVTDNNVGHKWISVKDRLPEFGKRVLILGNRKDGQFIYIDQVCADGNWLLVNWEVTHWMPLPEPPEP